MKDKEILRGTSHDFFHTPISEILVYLEKYFGRRFVVYVGRTDLTFNLLASEKHLDIHTEMRIRFTYKIAKMMISLYEKETTKSWFFGTNGMLNDEGPAYVIRHARSLDALKEVVASAEHFCFPS